MVFAIEGHSQALRAGFANAVTALAVAAFTVLATPAMASVYYAFNVVAETGVGGFTGLGNGPSINDKGKIAFVSTSAGGPTVTLWSPIGGLSDLASTLLSPNRFFGDSVRINGNDEVLSWNRLLPLGLYEIRVFRSGTPNDSSIMVRGLSGGQPYDLLYQNPAMNNTRVLEDRSSFIATGNKDGVCDPGEVCVSQIAFNAFRSGPLRGGNIVSAPGSQPIDVLYFRTLGVINVPGVNAVDFDNLKTAVFWSSHRGAREFAFVQVVNADFHHAMGPGGGSNNAAPIVGIATGGSSFTLEHQNGPLTFEMRGHAIKITAGTGAGQMRTIQGSYTYNATGIQFVQVDDPWVTPPDTTSQYIILHGSGGEGLAGNRYDGAFSPGKNLAITLAGYGRNPPGNHLGSFTDQWKTLAHEIGHLTSLMHGGRNHDNYKVNYVSLMNYAYENCVAPNVGRDGAGVNLPGAAACPINNYSLPTDLVSNDWHNLDLRSSLNFAVMGQAFGAPPDPPTSPSRDQPMGRTIKEVLDQNGPRDSQPPTVQITSPAGGAAFALGSTIPVSFMATDNVSVGNAEVLFDLNGDGSIDEATEVFPAVPGGGNTYTATIPAVSGPSGSRRVSVFAYDPAGNPGAAFVIVNVGSVAPGTIPGVVGQTEEDAIAAAESAVFTIGTITRQQSASVPAGSVISQNPPAGQSRPPGTVVILVISLGATGVIVPSVVGLSQSAATSAITGAGLTVGTVTQNASPAGPVASVLAQSPAGGAVAAGGTAVNLLVTSTIPTFTLDVDASVAATKYHAPTDGLLILRYLFGLAGTSLTNGALGVTATRTDPTVIKTYLDGNLTALDIDGNGKYDALTDGVLIVRYMLNLRGNALITGAFDPMGSRTTAFDIENHLLSLMPP